MVSSLNASSEDPMRVARVLNRFVAAMALLAIAGAAAAAQSTSHAMVRVTARDSSGAPVPGAELTVTRGVHDILAHGTTDDGGHAVIPVELKETEDLNVTMRKIGYRRGDRFFEVTPTGTADILLTVGRQQSTDLAPVTVTAKRDAKRASYFLSADDIENANLPVDNAWELIKRLRPDMLTSRGGCSTGAREVWVNGKRIRLPLPPTGMAAARARVGVPARARFSYVPVSVMSDIAPEHVQEISYHDCFDTSMAAVGSTDAVFIVLKPGVDYKQDVGSFVIDLGTNQK
jgi:hypothetical protein